MEHALKMDRLYSLQRHIYDATRRFYLLGRDRLLERLPVQRGGCVLEIGCGTGRNLARLRGLRPDLTLCGLDASSRMLETARAKLGPCVTLRQGLAEHLAPDAFGLGRPFDAVFFSYCLSMVPAWDQALACGMNALRPGGTLAVVDFWGQGGGLPGWFHLLHDRWLELFGVKFRPELLERLRAMERAGLCSLDLESVGRGFSFLAWLRKAG